MLFVIHTGLNVAIKFLQSKVSNVTHLVGSETFALSNESM